ncbi:hypothetical protein [Sporichthya sp.]|uniref:hypothetical protein n=1 Tax=Sporichthya sp. TaxID=65475 RepID=UPI00179A789C|nr:hypothetical protein [Sporichthya sp.]MBA3743626.1 hypothetical protein [Sporichthya sp.]
MDAEVEAWLSGSVLPDFGSQVAYDETARTWFRELYTTAGALSGEALWTAAVTHQFELAKDAVLAVYADLTATLTDRSLTIAPEIHGFIVRISVEGQFSEHDGGRMLAFGRDEALLEVARTVQDMITGLWVVWPECPEHGRAMMAESGFRPTWVCRTGPHEIAPIGSLGGG